MELLCYVIQTMYVAFSKCNISRTLDLYSVALELIAWQFSLGI